MSAEIVVLHPRQPSLAGYLRIGHKGHRRIQGMLAAGQFQYKRVVFDASHIAEQHELVQSLKKAGCEILLDPNFAEMSLEGKFKSSVSKLPWSNPDRPWIPEDFGPGRNLDVAKQIAEFAAAYGVSAILSPSHFSDQQSQSWRTTDLNLCVALRHELDHLGLSSVPIDFQVITTNASLKDGDTRAKIFSGINSLPIDNIWLRTSNSGANSTGHGTRSFIEAIREVHSIGKPIVADCLGGMVGLGILSFSAIGGLSHGMNQKESFNISHWKKPQSGGGGSTARVYIPELDRHLSAEQLRFFFLAKGAKSRFSCNDSDCCRQIDDMIENPERHFVIQRAKQLSDLSKVPPDRRADHYLLGHLGSAIRSSRFAAKLDFGDQKFSTLIKEAKDKLVRLEEALLDLKSATHGNSFSKIPSFRGGNSNSVDAVLAR